MQLSEGACSAPSQAAVSASFRQLLAPDSIFLNGIIRADVA